MRTIFQTFCTDLSKSLDVRFGSISAYLRANGDPFDRTNYLAHNDNYHKNMGLAEQCKAPNPGEVLPIEFFKDRNLLQPYLRPGPSTTRTFRSSGTTGLAQSHSPFSNEGLENYRIQSLLGFFAALQKKFGHLKAVDLSQVQGISLIPSTKYWPNSSLAQMLGWIGQSVPMTFIDEGQGTFKDINFDRPVWIFGTAFHFVNLVDDGYRQKLSENSLIIETGGTKGRSRTVTRPELFDLISEAFSISQTRIISEYGMSELATQAYDLDENPIENRWYRFPAWIDTWVLAEDGTIKKEGVGAIVIKDPFRSDIPFPIRTEDIVELRENKFKILRRSLSAPLKGCSLLAEQPTNKMTFDHSKYQKSVGNLDRQNEIQRAEQAHRLCSHLLGNPNVHAEFTKEFGHPDLASFAIDDIAKSLNLSPKELVEASKRAVPEPTPPTWTILAPNSHSLAAIHPVLLGFIAGIDLAVRLPEKFSNPGHFLSQLIQGLNQLRPNSIVMLPASFHIQSKSDVYRQGNILVFGTNETLSKLKNIAPGRVSGFGETLAVACGSLEDVQNYSNDIVRDFFSMRQAGCMSPRLFILQESGDNDLQLCLSALTKAASSYIEHLGIDDTIALHGEAIRLKHVDGSSPAIDIGVRLPLIFGSRRQNTRTVADMIAQKAYSIPVISIKNPDWKEFVKSLKTEFIPELPLSLILLADHEKNNEFLKNSLKSSMSTISFRAFGGSQSPPFSGLHEGRPIFSTNF